MYSDGTLGDAFCIGRDSLPGATATNISNVSSTGFTLDLVQTQTVYGTPVCYYLT